MQSKRKKRPHICTAEAIDRCIDFVGEGLTAGASAVRVGIRPSTCSKLKSGNQQIQFRVNEARAKAGERKYRKVAQERESRPAMRISAKRSKRIVSPKNANLVMWALTTQAPLNYVQLPEQLVRKACSKYRFWL